MRALYLLLRLFAASLAWFGAAESVYANQTVTLQLKWAHQFQFAGYYAALEQGFYREAGLNVRIQAATPGLDPVREVTEGRAEFGVGTSALLLARHAGAPVVAMAAIFQHSPYILLARADRGMTSMSDMAGRRIMLEPQADEIRALLRHADIDESRYHAQDHSFNLNDLVEGRTDAMAAYLTDETFALEQRGIPYLAFSPRSVGIDFYGDVLFTREELIRTQPDQVRAFREASIKGWQYAFEHTDEVIDLILRDYPTPLSRKHLRFEAEQMRNLIQPELIELGYNNPARWTHIARTYAELGLLPERVSLDGFIYEPEPTVPRSAYHQALLLGGAVALLAALLLLAVFMHNRGLRRDMGLCQAEEHMLRSLLQNAPFPVMVVGLSDNIIRFVNDRTLQQFGMDSRELIGARTPDFWVRSEERERFIKDAILYGAVRDWEAELKTSKGQHFWTLLSATRATLDDGMALIVAIHDITERRRRDEELRKAHQELEQANNRLQTTLAELETLARTDKLTGCWNRRHLEEAAGIEIGRARRYHQPLSLLVFDIDHFKQVNDRYGHNVGDTALRTLADLVRANVGKATFSRAGAARSSLCLPSTPPARKPSIWRKNFVWRSRTQPFRKSAH